MLHFTSDYIAGCHPEVLDKLVKTNLENLSGYATDIYSLSAEKKIKEACKSENIQVSFLVGGTQANQVVISTMLQPFQGVIAADTGHINVHEAGAIEYSGHKVLPLKEELGKIFAKDIDKYCEDYYADGNYEHMVYPGMVYISFPTELGTIYSKQELTDIYNVCKKYKMSLFIDGARLGYALASYENDVTLPDLVNLCDVFYIGGTKVGALCGEAVVFTHNNRPEAFVAQIKQHGALLAKGRLVGIQFDALFTDNLYNRIGEYGIKTAEHLKKVLDECGCRWFLKSPTNQQFIIVENDKLGELSKHIAYSFWSKFDDSHTVIRFVTSWSTIDSDIDEIKKYL